jgi:hypothetical protein
MPTAVTAAVTAASFVALFAGHQIGDHVVQSNADAAAKGAPTAELLSAGVHAWTGWPACARHVVTYALTQAAALALIAVVTPLRWSSAAAALAVSAGTHAVIDRRWIVRLMIQAKRCQDWREAPYLIDQSLHMGALLVAAVLAGVATSAAAAGAVAICTAGMVGAGLTVEKWLAARTAAACDHGTVIDGRRTT